jgi:hypothetical protein
MNIFIYINTYFRYIIHIAVVVVDDYEFQYYSVSAVQWQDCSKVTACTMCQSKFTLIVR